MHSTEINRWVGQNVARLRQGRGWSQAELATNLSGRLDRSIDPTTITRLERGTRPTSVTELAALAELLEQGMPDLLQEPLAMEAIAAANAAVRRVTSIQDVIAARCGEMLDAREALAKAVQRARTADPAANLDTADAVLSVTPEEALALALQKGNGPKRVRDRGKRVSAFGIDHGPAGPDREERP